MVFTRKVKIKSACHIKFLHLHVETAQCVFSSKRPLQMLTKSLPRCFGFVLLKAARQLKSHSQMSGNLVFTTACWCIKLWIFITPAIEVLFGRFKSYLVTLVYMTRLCDMQNFENIHLLCSIGQKPNFA